MTAGWDVSILDASGDCRAEAHELRRDLERYGLGVQVVLGPPLTHPGGQLEPDDAPVSVALLRDPGARVSQVVFVLTVAPATGGGIAVDVGAFDESLARRIAAYFGRPEPRLSAC